VIDSSTVNGYESERRRLAPNHSKATSFILTIPQTQPLVFADAALHSDSSSAGRFTMLFAIVSRGKKTGVRLYPHQFEDSRFGVSLTKQGPYIPLTDHRDIPEYLANGYSLHMSNLEEGRRPTLVKPELIQGWK